MPLALLALTISAFAIGTTEFVNETFSEIASEVLPHFHQDMTEQTA
ncbi:hypothetical protein [Paraburkholderia sp. J12]|nr:hypothetical protein [Paraburkholderia sp. J12]